MYKRLLVFGLSWIRYNRTMSHNCNIPPATAMNFHYNDVIMSAMVSQITSFTIVYSTLYSRRRSKKPSKLSVTGLCGGNSPVTFPAQSDSNAENVSIWRPHHVLYKHIAQTANPCFSIDWSIQNRLHTHAPSKYIQFKIHTPEENLDYW